MNIALIGARNVASVHAAPRCAPFRSAPGCGYAEQVWSMQAFGFVGCRSSRLTNHHRPNPSLNRTRRKQRRSLLAWVPARRLAHSVGRFALEDTKP